MKVFPHGWQGGDAKKAKYNGSAEVMAIPDRTQSLGKVYDLEMKTFMFEMATSRAGHRAQDLIVRLTAIVINLGNIFAPMGNPYHQTVEVVSKIVKSSRNC